MLTGTDTPLAPDITFLFTTICPSSVKTSSPRRRLTSSEPESPTSKNLESRALVLSGTAGVVGQLVCANVPIILLLEVRISLVEEHGRMQDWEHEGGSSSRNMSAVNLCAGSRTGDRNSFVRNFASHSFSVLASLGFLHTHLAHNSGAPTVGSLRVYALLSSYMQGWQG